MANTKSLKNISSIIFSLTLLGIEYTSSASAEVYRCQGRVSRFPCSNELPVSAHAVSFGMKRSNESTSPTVSEESLKILPKNQGLWLGRVRGDGLIKLELQIFRAGILESTRKMGQVVLNDKSTAFNFKSSLPEGTDWSWKITAY